MISAIGFFALGIATAAIALIGFQVASTALKTGLISIVLFIAALLSFTLGKLREQGFK
jgi:hypothetical protein